MEKSVRTLDRRVWAIVATVLMTALGAISEVRAQDTVALTTGNRMTGEIRELSRGSLSFAIDGAGTVDINWRNVKTLVSRRDLDIELRSGRRLSGLIAASDSGKIEFHTTSSIPGSAKHVIAMEEVVRITVVEASFQERTHGSVDLGVAFLTAASEKDLTLNGEIENRSRDFLNKGSLSSMFRRSDGENRQNRHHLALNSRRFFANRNFALGQFKMEGDHELDLRLRILLAAAIGRNFIQSNSQLFAMYAGIDYDREDYKDNGETDNTAEALGALEWDLFKIGGTTQIKTEATTYVSLGRSRLRFELDGSVRRELVRNFFWRLTVYESYDSDPPGDRTKSDFGVTFTLGYSF